jgi:hypothetical protein
MDMTTPGKPQPAFGQPIPDELRGNRPFLTLSEINERLDAIADYRPHTSGEKHYREFILRRDPTYTLWRIFNVQGNQLRGLEGSYTTKTLAEDKIDKYLEKQEAIRREKEATHSV